ncbi:MULTISPECIES: nuclear transport factor 2 family protein [Arthrobacter]|uniref:Nuclear transport factor 2 family protein n=2 Tax=Arthrobacter TaxID=1663 RepID=A0ABU9KN79_9MICC|nr:nuclear transport factor 2 family protein [Arthrobacter sp. YJM1]MDP5227565.1 nuclear transport factor 2 family protein [Arthrobacter sp. YJM1]
MALEPTRERVAAAAAEIVSAFAANDGERYFSLFAPDASFVFHPEPRRFDARAEYEAAWQGWVDGGWRVLECTSLDPLIQTFPGGAVFSHTVRTRVDTGTGAEEMYTERESIVFRGHEGGLLAVHEHLSLPSGE